MKQYVLKTKDGDVINITTQICLSDAIEYFSKMKMIPKKELLKIYTVEEDENRNYN
jgi:hypothetical protein